ncbi:methyltransferase family protein [Azospirillum baldaniorum]|uniref:class I SAM-dependent methyltransferase n=1 Tax=Azospirillum baldaniorum TaxID=1064539 RepID=UPI0011ADA4FC|nr:class I SAM-dependent methyltransferase [Azospirillum baldaniorum]TWA53815.1 methyltransferase family protein [Azospirillum baldaniorum]
MPYNLSIPGQMSEWELQAIEAVAALVPPDGTIVEIGSLFGRSSWAWAKSADPSVTVHCIDPWEENHGIRPMEQALGITYGIDQFRAYLSDCPNAKALQGYSPDNFQDWNRPVDLFFEDSVHTDPILSRNLEFWSRHLPPTGISCGHDYRPRFPDVMNGVDRLARSLEREILVVDTLWCLLPPVSKVPAAKAVREKLLTLAAEARTDALTRPYAHTFQLRNKPDTVSPGGTMLIDVYACNESRHPWMDGSGAPATAHVSVHVHTEHGETSGALLPLPKSLSPDRPVTAQLSVCLGPLPPGTHQASARLVLISASGEVLRTFETEERWTVRMDGNAALPTSLRLYQAFQTDRPVNFESIDALDVHAAYRILLGRPPEGPQQVASHLAAAQTLSGLRRRFMTSQEFISGNLKLAPSPPDVQPAPAAGRAHDERTPLADRLPELLRNGLNGLFKPSTDPTSGVTSYLLRRSAAPLQQSFYFTQPCWSRDGRFLWLYCAHPPSGSARDGRTLAVVDFQTGTLTNFPETQFTDASPWVDSHDGSVVWATQNAVWRRSPETGGQPVCLTRIPDDLLRKRPVWRLATHLTRSADGAWFLLDITVGGDRLLGGIPFEGGDLQIWQRLNRGWHHAQFSPTDPDLILLAEEERIDPLTGRVTPPQDRMALSRREGPLRPLGLGATVGHEWWDRSGTAIWYVDFERGTMRVGLDGQAPECVWPAGNWHASASRCGRYLVADTRPETTQGRGPSTSVLFLNRQTKRAVPIVTAMPVASPSLEPYHLHPHPSFQCDDRMVVYTTHLAGGLDLAVVPVAHLVAATS